MTRSQTVSLAVCVFGASCLWLTLLKADEKSSSGVGDDRVNQLLARIEKLERRVETLEQARLAVRKIDRQLVPAAAGLLNSRPEDAKPALPHGAIVVPPKAEQRPAGTVFLPRHIELKPE